MTLQARMSAHDQRFYNPSRDVAHHFADAVREVTARLDAKRWPELMAILERDGVGPEELSRAMASMCIFTGSLVEQPKATMTQNLQRSGWFDAHSTAQIAICALLGTYYLGVAYVGIKEATLGGAGPALEAADLKQAGLELLALQSMPPWRRRVWRWTSSLRAAWRAFRGRD